MATAHPDSRYPSLPPPQAQFNSRQLPSLKDLNFPSRRLPPLGQEPHNELPSAAASQPTENGHNGQPLGHVSRHVDHRRRVSYQSGPSSSGSGHPPPPPPPPPHRYGETTQQHSPPLGHDPKASEYHHSKHDGNGYLVPGMPLSAQLHNGHTNSHPNMRPGEDLSRLHPNKRQRTSSTASDGPRDVRMPAQPYGSQSHYPPYGYPVPTAQHVRHPPAHPPPSPAQPSPGQQHPPFGSHEPNIQPVFRAAPPPSPSDTQPYKTGPSYPPAHMQQPRAPSRHAPPHVYHHGPSQHHFPPQQPPSPPPQYGSAPLRHPTSPLTQTGHHVPNQLSAVPSNGYRPPSVRHSPHVPQGAFMVHSPAEVHPPAAPAPASTHYQPVAQSVPPQGPESHVGHTIASQQASGSPYTHVHPSSLTLRPPASHAQQRQHAQPPLTGAIGPGVGPVGGPPSSVTSPAVSAAPHQFHHQPSHTYQSQPFSQQPPPPPQHILHHPQPSQPIQPPATTPVPRSPPTEPHPRQAFPDRQEQPTLMDAIVKECSLLYEFSQRFAQHPNAQPAHAEWGDMVARATMLVQMLEDLRTQMGGDRSKDSSPSTIVTREEHHQPKRPWEDFSHRGNTPAQSDHPPPLPPPSSRPESLYPVQPPYRPLTESKPFIFAQMQGPGVPPPPTAPEGPSAGPSAEQDMELIRSKRASSAAAAANNAPGQPKSKYKKRSRAILDGQCHSCNIKETPEWRRGPDGARTLCNACGLHYAKLMRKQENKGPDAPVIDMETLRASARAAEQERLAKPKGAGRRKAAINLDPGEARSQEPAQFGAPGQGTFQIISENPGAGEAPPQAPVQMALQGPGGMSGPSLASVLQSPPPPVIASPHGPGNGLTLPPPSMWVAPGQGALRYTPHQHASR
ncbi:hypothetical protein CYLTODRAFT_445742 [Cylindrobasidium torrendii FP15055 ss-10]|uniref:GATA-type domain-containing protein n=1 Tax=Cylindrobasidium torrendii FP15055 ss-10 TaxID=1314674 RepID=A0A0D7B2M5_9AGAR|nr:hypothetical protein CYLTODRAFT_445742 [Cylindrobasidium torrendii FP15055 ss-10]